MKYLFLLLAFISCKQSTTAQKNCGSSLISQTTLQRFPELKNRYGNTARSTPYVPISGEIIIPVIVNIVYHKLEENLSDAVIREQIRILNQDFSATNPDLQFVPGPFRDRISGDCGIRFVLKDITRTPTKTPVFTTDLSITGVPENDAIKFTHLGGRNGTGLSSNLNIWVGNIRSANPDYNPLGGYAPRPGSLTDFDGVVINYANFGSFPSSANRYNKGRTLTHETGHWLNLMHLWGEYGNCSTDEVEDTPPQEMFNLYQPNFPKVSSYCNNSPYGDLFMNFMDYVYDDCMFMFTKLQKERMRATFGNAAFRGAILHPSKQTDTSAIKDISAVIRVKLPSVQNIIQTAKKAVATWDASLPGENYMVLMKEVKDTKWDTTFTKKNGVKLTGLAPGKLYELKVITLQKNNKKQEGLPYLFMANENFLELDMAPKMIELF